MLSRPAQLHPRCGRSARRSCARRGMALMDVIIGGIILGIGLTVVKNLVEMHGAAIDVHAEGEGTGAEFVVRIPRTQKRKDPKT